MRTILKFLLAGVFVAILAPAHAFGQTYIDQQEVEKVLTANRVENLDELPEIYYEYYILKDSTRNSVRALNKLYATLGKGNPQVGKENAKVVQMINRTWLPDAKVGDTLVVPNLLEIDFRAFSPFPRYYPGARNFNKLFIIHKSIQAWAAYENGKLARWGVVNTGGMGSETPGGRYNFNYRMPEKKSSLSPPGEDWMMYWVVNIHLDRGIHIHQYAMPVGPPESHGCVRLVDADARWIYDWADLWVTTKGDGNKGEASTGGRVLKQGTTVLVLGEEPKGVVHPFKYTKRYPVLTKVKLPEDPYSVPPGTSQQVEFDKKRLRAER